MGKSFDQLVKEKGSVSAALASQGYEKGSSGSWSKGGSSGSGSSGRGGGSSGGTISATKTYGSGGSGYYDPNVDYSLAIKQAQAGGAADQLARLQQERQNKINALYGGVDPYKGTSDIMGGYFGGGYGGGPVSQSINYQALINQAVESGEYQTAALYEQLRNQKILSQDYKGQQQTTDLYSQYLPQNQQFQPPQMEIPSFDDYISQVGFDQYSNATQKYIQAAVQQAVNGYNAQIETANKDSDELARQAYLAKMLGQKNLDQQVSAAGYAGGMADSQRIQTETAYQNNLQEIENQRIATIAALEQAIQEAKLTGDMQAAQELTQYLQALQSQWSGYVQNMQKMQNNNYWNQQSVNAQQQSTAYGRAMDLLASGIMPGNDILAQANISSMEAAAIRNFYLQQLQPGGAHGTEQGIQPGGGPGSGKQVNLKDLSSFDTEDFTNAHGGETVRVESASGATTYITWKSAQKYVENGSMKIVANGDGTYTLKMA